ncbi:hypothetical protein DDZ18_13460 [Marinicauda salina]|uniref:Cell division coordinator CpoB n=1 Tax=Marinicauda salina TaxID=2135793 RepID=A0A2U2BQY5_9PROT|nr:tetratricopeptide repeat protein [Marinicauda salina]PWE16421.1 hypothetical protein DDZ18_13460 [Marinicauda salina]
MLRFAVLMLLTVVMTAPASAQSRRELAARLDQVEARLAEMEESFLAGDPVAETLLTRVDALEREQRALTGELERLNYENRQLRQELDRLGVDVDRLLSGGAGSAGGPAALEAGSGQAETAAGETATGESVAVVDPDDPYAADRAAITRPLQAPSARSGDGGASQPAAGATAGTATGAASAPSALEPEELFRQGRSRLLDGDFGGAQESFAAFTGNHADHELADEAWYWLGETHFVLGEFQDAADSYLASLQAARRGDRAPDALVRLAASLAAMGQTGEACNVLDSFDAEFPNADAEARRKAEREASRAGCG